MPTISTSAAQVAYDALGSGPAVLLLPSGAHDRHDYDGVRALLPRRFRSIAIDWPSHGDSPGWNRVAHEQQLAGLVEEVLESVAPEGAVLVGHSIGGNVAARLALARPELVNGLMLIGAGGFEAKRLSARVFCALMSRPWFVRLVYPALSRWYMRPRTEADRRARASSIATTRSPSGRRAISDMWSSFTMFGHDLRDRAGQINVPAAVVWGRRDPILPLGAAETAHGLIKGSTLLVIDSGHTPQTTDPAAVAAELTALLEVAYPAGDPAEPASPHGKGRQR